MHAQTHACKVGSGNQSPKLRVFAGLPTKPSAVPPSLQSPARSTAGEEVHQCSYRLNTDHTSQAGHRQFKNGTRCFHLSFVKNLDCKEKCIAVAIYKIEAGSFKPVATHFGSNPSDWNGGVGSEEIYEVCLDQGEYSIDVSTPPEYLYPSGTYWSFGIMIGGVPVKFANFSINAEGMVTDDVHSTKRPRNWRVEKGELSPSNTTSTAQTPVLPMQCYTWWRGEEPALPSTSADHCGGYASFGDVEECDQSETHCWYIESTSKGKHRSCLRWYGVGGCHSSLKDVWQRTLLAASGAPEPQRGFLSSKQCTAIATALLDTTQLPSLCISCEGSLCARESMVDWTDHTNMMKVPHQSLVAAQTGLSRQSTRCTTAQIDNLVCDAECNNMQNGFDRGSCCGTSEDYGCLPWSCQDRKDAASSGETCAQMTPEECKKTATFWDSPDQKPADACPVTCGTCNSSNQNILVSWPYALTIGDGTTGNERFVMPSMPASFHRVLREQQVAQHEAEHGEVTDPRKLYDELLSALPSLACPECAATTQGSKAYRSIPFNVSGDPPQTMFQQLDETKPRMRFLSHPNLVLYGILLTQKRKTKRACSVAGNTLLAHFSYLGPNCHDEPSKEPFGADPTFVRSKSVYSAREAVPDTGVPFAFTFDQGDPKGLAEDYPVFFDVDLNRSHAKKLMDIVIEGGYFDASTESAKATMLLMNLEIGSIAKITIESERYAAGAVSFDVTITLIDLYPYSLTDTADVIRLACEILALSAIVVMLSIEIRELYHKGIRKYVCSFQNLIDFLSYGLICAVFGSWVQYAVLTHRFSKEAKSQYNVYANPMATNRILRVNSEISKLVKQFSDMEAIENKLGDYDQLVAFAMTAMVLQLLKNLDFHPSIGIVSRTMQSASFSLLVLLGVQFAIITLYSVQGMVLLGQITDEFASVAGAVKSLVLFLCGQLPSDLPESIPIQVFFWSYMLISVFIMLNALLAVIMDAYSEVTTKDEGLIVPDPLEIEISHVFGFQQCGLLPTAVLLSSIDKTSDHEAFADRTFSTDLLNGMVFVWDAGERHKVQSKHASMQ